tara:strand:+ start:2140 stop:4986 length:2847 start_codon:yes stop_codon:yes gene_type:complete
MSTPSLTTQYTDIKIIDCNRQHSIQANSGNDENTALFTNEIGNGGLQLKVGDTVSVQGAFISEIGAGADTVEFKGKPTGLTRTINYVSETPNYYTTLDDGLEDVDDLITGFQEYTIDENASLTYPIVDNETYITNQYYLNTAGDSGYVSLPRRFITPNGFSANNASMWTDIDSITSGLTYHPEIGGQFPSDDYYWYDNSSDSEAAVLTGFYKLKNDCSRFTLMKRGGTLKLRRKTIDHLNASTIENGYPPTADYIHGSKYYIFKDPVKISVKSGFNSQESISESITNQLKEASEPNVFKVKYEGVVRDLSVYYTTNTLKPQICGTDLSTSYEAWNAFYGARGGAAADKDYAWEYWSNYYNIYVKRPELRELGQLINTGPGVSEFKVLTAVDIANRTTDTIQTDIPFTEAKLQELQAFFKAQKLYPDLFDNNNAQTIMPPYSGVKMSSDNCRFIHMTSQISGTFTYLGGDNVQVSGSLTNNSSRPLFFYFDKANEDIGTDGSNITNLSYGFATKWTNASGSFIELHPELLGGINVGLFQDDAIVADTPIGYDYHFNAYGNAAVMGYNGRLPSDLPLANAWGIGSSNQEKVAGLSMSKLLRLQYVGTNNPEFGYDPDNSRFYFSSLHTPELSGQSWISAGDNGSGVSPVVPDNTANGGDIVYKINKRINPYTFTPDMRPYNLSYDPAITYNYGGAGSLTERTISEYNRNIQAWSVFDSMSGIYISDFGYDRETWDTGLWGILGFSYDQFNFTESSANNRLTRVINNNKNNLNIPTTNSDIVSSDTRNYIVNQFGSVYFTTQIPTSSYLHSGQGSSTHEPTFLPAITQKTESIKLNAVNLPRKMLRPYYCIRSDIIDKPHYIGGQSSNNLLPVMNICSKQYSGGDFYFTSEEDYEFTITKEKTITNITTSIHDPDQTFSKVNGDSAVIYKIKSQVVNQLDLAQQLLKSLKK